MNASKALHLSQHCLGETFQMKAPYWCQQGWAGEARATSQAVQPPSIAGHGPAGTQGCTEHQTPPHPPIMLRNCSFIQLFPDCPFLCPCSFLVQTPSPCPRGAGRRARRVGQSWTREEAGKRVIRSGQHWTRLLRKEVSIVETK